MIFWQKMVSPVSLCEEKHYKELRRGIARTFKDGMGEISKKIFKWRFPNKINKSRFPKNSNKTQKSSRAGDLLLQQWLQPQPADGKRELGEIVIIVDFINCIGFVIDIITDIIINIVIMDQDDFADDTGTNINFPLTTKVIRWWWWKNPASGVPVTPSMKSLGLFIAPKCVKSPNQLPFHTMKKTGIRSTCHTLWRAMKWRRSRKKPTVLSNWKRLALS